MTDILEKLCPLGHKIKISTYVWGHFLFHRCPECRRLYNFHELTEEQT